MVQKWNIDYKTYLTEWKNMMEEYYSDKRHVILRNYANEVNSMEDEDILLDDEEYLNLKEKIKKLEDENYILKEELKGYDVSSDRYSITHNLLKGFDEEDFIPVTHIGDNYSRKSIIEIQTGDESVNKVIGELVLFLLNKGVFDKL